MRVAIQGILGSFHDQVAKQWYGNSVQVVPCTTFRDVFSAYQQGDADAIVVATENTIYGSINEVHQLIEACDAPIIGEIALPIEQMLIANAGVARNQITEVYSHPVALAQCTTWLQQNLPQAELIEFYDTAGAVEYVKGKKLLHAAAIAGERAAAHYRLPVIARSIQDSDDNITRFLIIEPTQSSCDANRSSLVITTSHRPGALVEVLRVFADAGVNLAKLQSQPIIGHPFTYKFFIVVDAAGQLLYDLVKRIEQNDHQVALLGEYRAAIQIDSGRIAKNNV